MALLRGCSPYESRALPHGRASPPCSPGAGPVPTGGPVTLTPRGGRASEARSRKPVTALDKGQYAGAAPGTAGRCQGRTLLLERQGAGVPARRGEDRRARGAGALHLPAGSRALKRPTPAGQRRPGVGPRPRQVQGAGQRHRCAPRPPWSGAQHGGSRASGRPPGCEQSPAAESGRGGGAGSTRRPQARRPPSRSWAAGTRGRQGWRQGRGPREPGLPGGPSQAPAGHTGPAPSCRLRRAEHATVWGTRDPLTLPRLGRLAKGPPGHPVEPPLPF